MSETVEEDFAFNQKLAYGQDDYDLLDDKMIEEDEDFKEIIEAPRPVQ